MKALPMTRNRNIGILRYFHCGIKSLVSGIKYDLLVVLLLDTKYLLLTGRYLRPALSAHTAPALATRPVSAPIANANCRYVINTWVFMGIFKRSYSFLLHALSFLLFFGRCLWPALCAHTTPALATGRYPLLSLTRKSTWVFMGIFK